MSDTAQHGRPEPEGSSSLTEGRTLEKGSGRKALGDPATRGRTTIADGVVEKIAGLAARDVVGVHAMGTGLSRTFGAVRDRVPGSKSVTRGVKAEVGEVQTALDLDIVVDYGVSIVDVARAVRRERDRRRGADDRPGGRRGQHRRRRCEAARRGRRRRA